MKQAFICEICGESFNNAIDAEDCEKSHWNIDREKLEDIETQEFEMNYDSIMYLIVPCKREHIDGTIEHYKMRFKLDGFVFEDKDVKGGVPNL